MGTKLKDKLKGGAGAALGYVVIGILGAVAVVLVCVTRIFRRGDSR